MFTTLHNSSPHENQPSEGTKRVKRMSSVSISVPANQANFDIIDDIMSHDDEHLQSHMTFKHEKTDL